MRRRDKGEKRRGGVGRGETKTGQGEVKQVDGWRMRWEGGGEKGVACECASGIEGGLDMRGWYMPPVLMNGNLEPKTTPSLLNYMTTDYEAPPNHSITSQ